MPGHTGVRPCCCRGQGSQTRNPPAQALGDEAQSWARAEKAREKPPNFPAQTFPTWLRELGFSVACHSASGE